MRVKFIKNTYFSNGTPRYKFGLIYDLPDNEAQALIAQNYATPANPLTGFLKIKRPDSNIFKELKITPKTGTKISLTALNKSEQELITSKNWGKGVNNYLKNNKDVSVADISEILLSILNYAIDNKDSQTIDRVTRDLSIIYKLVKIKKANNDK